MMILYAPTRPGRRFQRSTSIAQVPVLLGSVGLGYGILIEEGVLFEMSLQVWNFCSTADDRIEG